MNDFDKETNAIPEPATLHELAGEAPAQDADGQEADVSADAAVDVPDADGDVQEPAGEMDDFAVVEELARLRTELDSARERLLRQAAEFQNYRRRAEAEKMQSVALGKSLVVQHLLDVFDDFGRSIDAAEKVGETPDAAVLPEAFASLRQGVALVFDKLRAELEKLGVKEIEVIGRPFDVEEHEALMQQPAPEGQAAGMVLGELQKGYRMGDRVIRHAKVIVSA